MSDAMQGLLSEAKSGRYSTIKDTLSDDDVANVWESVCEFIAKQMSQQKGVNICGLGTFSLSQQKLDVGNNKFILIQRPVFNIAEKFVQTLALQSSKHYVTGHIPVVPLNYAAISYDSPFDRDTIESCVREILNAIARAIGNRRNVELLFTGIGRLSVRDSKVKMKFFKEYINQMDGSGRLAESLQNRPGTVDSVMSNRSLSRCGSSTLILPNSKVTRINSRNQSQPMCLTPVREEIAVPDQPLHEEDPGARQLAEDLAERYAKQSGYVPESQEAQLLTPGAREGLEGLEEEDMMTAAAIENILREGEPVKYYEVEYTPQPPRASPREMKKSVVIVSRSSSRQAMPLPCASGINIAEELPAPEDNNLTGQPRQSPPQMEQMPHPLTAPSSRSPPGHLAPLERPATADSTCGHANAGQELCYLCHQRARRNIPVSFAEERRRREEEEEKLLQQFHIMRDAEETLKEHEKRLEKHHELQKLAAFNLGVAEATTAKKKAKDNSFHRSYIFQRRPLTPPKFPKQEEYSKELCKQVNEKESVKEREKAETEYIEKLEQVQLAEDIARLREKEQREKAERREMIKRGLDTQIRFKPLPIPAAEKDGEVFGKNDMTNEKMMEKRKRAYELFQSQQELVAQKKREAILKKLSEQREEEEVLARAKRELLDDRAARYGVRMHTRKYLEDEWSKTVQMKRAREAEEHLASLSPGGLVHEQCDKYRRCRRCTRKLTNQGWSDILWRWKPSLLL